MDLYSVTIEIDTNRLIMTIRNLTKEGDKTNTEREGYAENYMWVYVKANNRKEAMSKAKEKFIQHYQSLIEDIESTLY